MPIYEFRCMECDEEFETLVFGSGNDIQCPKCSSSKLKRLMSSCGFKSSGEFTPSAGSGGCASCAGGNCSTCH
ncbi:MAG: zinc ribbon domain-containing protein [Deltaproteobacteria bacterium]|nr:zinc ribbon domain-containing protein [Deltaproteobacteria bacterium]